jgi:ribA/ribD-fused uncharacterized protein
MSDITRFRGKFGFLSNFYSCPVRVDGVTYPSSEHAYQALKTIDPIEREKIRCAKTPGSAKKLGRKVKMIDDFDRLRVMRRVLWAKFRPGTSLSQMLIDTGDRFLIEGNNWNDVYFGVCRGKGQNILGILLMERRLKLTGVCKV